MTAIIIALTIHETGHLIALIILNIKFKKIKITFMGFNLNVDLDNVSFVKKSILLFCGPLFNCIMFVIFKYMGQYDFAKLNIFLAYINMIPIIPLDGGNICKALLENVIDKKAACRYMMLTNGFFIVCFGVSLFIYKNWMYFALIIMALKGIIEEKQAILEKSIRSNYYSTMKKW